jgi:hypothetical protein
LRCRLSKSAGGKECERSGGKKSAGKCNDHRGFGVREAPSYREHRHARRRIGYGRNILRSIDGGLQ